MKILNTNTRPPRAIFALALLLCLSFVQYLAISEQTKNSLEEHKLTLEAIREERSSRNHFGLTTAIYYESANLLAGGLDFDSGAHDPDKMTILYQLMDQAHATSVPGLSEHAYGSLRSVLSSEAKIALQQGDIQQLQTLHLYQSRALRAELQNWETLHFHLKCYNVKGLLADLEASREHLTPELVYELKRIREGLQGALISAYDVDLNEAINVHDDPLDFLLRKRYSDTQEKVGLKATLVSLSGIDILKDQGRLEFLDRYLADRVSLLNNRPPKSPIWAKQLEFKLEMEGMIDAILGS